jgi:hypothetical protein
MTDSLSPFGRALLVLASKYGGPVGQGRSAIARWAGVHRSHLYQGQASRPTVERAAAAIGIPAALVWQVVIQEESVTKKNEVPN